MMTQRNDIPGRIDAALESATPVQAKFELRVGDTVETTRGTAQIKEIAAIVITPDGTFEMNVKSAYLGGEYPPIEAVLTNSRWVHGWQIHSVNGKPIKI